MSARRRSFYSTDSHDLYFLTMFLIHNPDGFGLRVQYQVHHLTIIPIANFEGCLDLSRVVVLVE
jgi:hypothetical protein